MTKEYYEFNEMYCIKGTVNSFADYDEMVKFAKENDWELVEIETPENVTEDMLVW